MARSGFMNISPRVMGVAVAFVLATVTAYQVGRRRAPEPADRAPYGDDAGVEESDEESDEEDEAEPAPAADEPQTAPTPARAADAAAPIIIMAPPPPARPPRDVLIVGARPAPVDDEPTAAAPAAEPEAPLAVAGEPKAPAPAPSAPLNREITHSTFDDQTAIDRHPVPDRSVTRSIFDDDDRVDRHPVP